jgi:hypothetical protein
VVLLDMVKEFVDYGGNAKRSFACKCVPKLELGNEGLTSLMGVTME